MVPGALPTRDPTARARLREVARTVAPAVPARDRLLPVPGELGALLPRGALVRGTTVAVTGALGAGATTVATSLAAAVTAAGEWVAVVDPPGTFGARAAADGGVALERCALVRRVPAARWPTVVAALLDGVAMVVAGVPPHVRAGDARRLVARARERAALLVVLGPWPAESVLRLHVDAGAWSTEPDGALRDRSLHVHAEGRGAPARRSVRGLTRTG